jgi:hypothetical protein
MFIVLPSLTAQLSALSIAVRACALFDPDQRKKIELANREIGEVRRCI